MPPWPVRNADPDPYRLAFTNAQADAVPKLTAAFQRRSACSAPAAASHHGGPPADPKNLCPSDQFTFKYSRAGSCGRSCGPASAC